MKKNLFKRAFASVSAFLMLASMVNVAMLPATHAADADTTEAWTWLHDNGLTTADSADAFNGLNSVTRAQFATFAWRFAKKFTNKVEDSSRSCSFPDVSASYDANLKAGIEGACKMGIMWVGVENFKPDDIITRKETATILDRLTPDGDTRNTTSPNWYVKHMEYMHNNGVVSNTNPGLMDRRAYVGLMMKRLVTLKLVNETSVDCDSVDVQLACLLWTEDCPAECSDTPSTWNVETGHTCDAGYTWSDTAQTCVVIKEGNLDVKVWSSNPSGRQIPWNWNNIHMMSFVVTAWDHDVTLNNVTIKKTAYTKNESVKALYVKNSKWLILTNQRALNSDWSAVLNFKGWYVLKAGSSEELKLYVDVVSWVNKQFQFEISNAEYVDATANVSWGFPIVWGLFNWIDYTAESIKFTSNKTWTAYDTSATSELTVWDTNTEIWRFTLNVSSENKKDVYIKSIRLRNQRNVWDYFDGIKIQSANEINNVDVVVDWKFVTFLFEWDWYKVPYWNNVTFYVLANVIWWDKNDIVQFKLDDTSDIVAYEEDTQASLSIKNDWWYTKAYKIAEWDNLITKSSDSPITSNIWADSAETDVFYVNINFKSEVYVEKMTMTVKSSTTWATKLLDKVKLYINDTFIDEWTLNWSTYTFNVYKNLVWLSKAKITVETQKDAPTDETFSFTIDWNSFDWAEYTATNNTVWDDINGSATSSTFTLKVAKFNPISRIDWFSDWEVVVANSELKVWEFKFDTNNVRDVVVNSFDVKLMTWWSTAAQNVSNITIKYNWIEKTKSLWDTTWAVASFNTLWMSIPVWSSVNVEVYANVVTTYTGSLEFKLTNFDIDAINPDWSTSKLDDPSDVSTVEFSVVDWAELTIAKISDNSPSSTIVPLSDEWQEIAIYDLRAEKDDALITEIAFEVPEDSVNLWAQFALFSEDWTSLTDYKWVSKTDSGVYYVNYTFSEGKYIELKEDKTTNLVVKMKTNWTINSTWETNKKINVLLTGFDSNGSNAIYWTTAQTKVVSKSNSSDITKKLYWLAWTLKSNDMYVRKTNLNVEVESADASNLVVVLSTRNDNDAAIYQLPIEFKTAWITWISIDEVLVNWNSKDVNTTVASVNWVTELVFTNWPVDIASNWTRIEVKYSLTLVSSANTIDAKVRVPEAKPTTSSNYFKTGTASAIASLPWEDWIVRSDKSIAWVETGTANWFTSAEIVWVDTSWIDIQ